MATERFLGHRPNHGFYVVILLLLAFFVGLVALHFRVVSELRAEQQQTLQQLAQAQADLDHYKKAYQSALEDAQALGKIYDITYRGNATPTSTAGAEPAPSDVKHLPSVDVWDYYNKQGVITDSCIPTAKLVQTPSDIVEVVIVANGVQAQEWPRVTLLIDGAFINSFEVAGTEQLLKTSVELPKGTHHLDILYTNAAKAGSLEIPAVRIGDRTLDNTVSVIDLGTGFAMFDCQDTVQGSNFTGEGAMRFKIEKI